MGVGLAGTAHSGILRVGFNLNNVAVVRLDGNTLVGPAPLVAKAICDAADVS